MLEIITFEAEDGTIAVYALVRTFRDEDAASDWLDSHDVGVWVTDATLPRVH